MFTAQVVLIIAAVAFVALAIAGSAQFVQIKFPELKPWSRWLLGIAGAGLFAAAFLIPSVANQSPGQAPSASPAPTAPISGSPSSPNTSTSPTQPVASGPVVQLIAPTGGTAVPQSKGFVARGTARGLGNDTIWLTDYDGGYTVDNEAAVNGNGAWSVSDSDLGNSDQSLPFNLTARIILADSHCADRLQATYNTNNDYLITLPGGCAVVGSVKVRVTTP
jgi:hypothetical protein